jgi:hypothetical protein
MYEPKGILLILLNLRVVFRLATFDFGKCVGLIALAILCLPFVIRPAIGQGNQVTIPLLTKQITLDGIWTSTDEWTDAAEITTPGGFFRLKHDLSYLYALLDYVSDNALENYDVAWVYIDTLKNGGNTPQTDDYAFSLQWSSTSQSSLVMQKGTGSDWVSSSPLLHSAVSSTVATNDPYSSTPHVVYEFKLPLSILPSGTAQIGVRLAMQNGAMSTWMVYPKDSIRTMPNQWGAMELGASPIPEFSAILPILALVMIFPLYLLKRSKEQSS